MPTNLPPESDSPSIPGLADPAPLRPDEEAAVQEAGAEHNVAGVQTGPDQPLAEPPPMAEPFADSIADESPEIDSADTAEEPEPDLPFAEPLEFIDETAAD